MKRRSLVIWSLFGVTAVATALMARGPDAGKHADASAAKGTPVRQSGSPTAMRDQPPPQISRVELERFAKQKQNSEPPGAVANAFNSKSWRAPPPPPPPPAPLPPPEAPPLPFTYLGRYADVSKMVVILARGERVYTVSEGEVIDGTYRVEKVADDTVDLVYLPMKITQSLSMVTVPDNNPLRARMSERYRRP